MKIDLIVAGKMGKGPLFDVLSEYQRRLKWRLDIYEFDIKSKNPKQVQKAEAERFLERLNPRAFKVVMDERGKSMKSLDFAGVFQRQLDIGNAHFQFIIGGADGLLPEVRGEANLLLSFGGQTWPHMLARVMLLEQIYRAQQILDGHPYHRE